MSTRGSRLVAVVAVLRLGPRRRPAPSRPRRTGRHRLPRRLRQRRGRDRRPRARPGCSSAEDPFEGLSDADGDCNRVCEGPAFRLRLDRDGPERRHALLRARIRTPLAECLVGRVVSLYRVERGPDDRLHLSGTGGGRWKSLLPERPGRYYVVLHALETPYESGAEAVRCARVESDTLRLGKKIVSGRS